MNAICQVSQSVFLHAVSIPWYSLVSWFVTVLVKQNYTKVITIQQILESIQCKLYLIDCKQEEAKERRGSSDLQFREKHSPCDS